MPELLSNPRTWMFIGAVVLAAVVFGRVRREPAWAIALTAVGASAALFGVLWASDLAGGALGPVFLVGTGMYLWTVPVERTRMGRSPVPPHAAGEG